MKIAVLPSFKFVVVCFLFTTQVVLAKEPGNWTMFLNQTRIHTNWSLHSEFQYRSFSLAPTTEQVLLRVGLNYHFDPSLLFTAGYARIATSSTSDNFNYEELTQEDRIWQQILLKSNLNRVFFEHRYRFEQRWISKPTNNEFKTRLRYLFRVTVPFNSKQIEPGVVFGSFYNEVFIQPDKVPFDRNRAYIAAGYQFNKVLSLQVGYLIQTVGNQSKQYAQLLLNYTPDLRKPEIKK